MRTWPLFIHYHMRMESNPVSGKRLAKSIAQAAAAVLVVLALGAAVGLTWKAQGRTREDTTFTQERARYREAQFAKSVLPQIDRYEALMNTVSGLKYGTPQWKSSAAQFTELQNLIGEEVPALIWHLDENGNVVLVGPDMARKHLQAIIALDPTTRQQ